MFEFVQIKKCHSWTKLGPSQLLKNRSLIPTLSYSVFNFQAPLHFLVSGLTGNEVPKYHENGCACGEAGLAEEMETWTKSPASQILERSVAWLPDQQGSDRFWIAAKPLEAFQNELTNLKVCPLFLEVFSRQQGANDSIKSGHNMHDLLPFVCSVLLFPPPLTFIPTLQF